MGFLVLTASRWRSEEIRMPNTIEQIQSFSQESNWELDLGYPDGEGALQPTQSKLFCGDFGSTLQLYQTQYSMTDAISQMVVITDVNNVLALPLIASIKDNQVICESLDSLIHEWPCCSEVEMILYWAGRSADDNPPQFLAYELEPKRGDGFI
jgi:hypothetical protein